jgi:hypothetical protein
MTAKRVISVEEMKKYEIKFKTLIPHVKHFDYNGKSAMKSFDMNMMMRAVGLKVTSTIWREYYEPWLKDLGYSEEKFENGAKFYVKL